MLGNLLFKSFGTLAVAGAVLGGFAMPAAAYPSSVVFVPNGQTMGLGTANLSFYNAYYGSLSSTWLGLNLGLLPELSYGGSGLTFPGFEVGIDVIGQAGLDPDVKPLGNAKLGLVKEVAWVPDLAVGIMSWAFLHPNRSLNFGYASASKTVAAGNTEYGRFTLGYGQVFPTATDQFTPTPPIGGNGALMVGYEFPAIGPFTTAIDHVGGNSEVSGTSLVINAELVPGTYASVGYAIGHDRKSSFPDGYFIQTYTNFEFAKAFGPPQLEPAAEEKATTRHNGGASLVLRGGPD